MPLTVSACATGASCAGTADEVKTTVVYGTTGTANNLLPTQVSSGSGTTTLATVTTAYDHNGDTLTVDGPLSGTADTTRYRYDASRRMVGVIGPDPDGAGAGLHRAQRVTYDVDGSPTLTEVGTTTGYGDAAWTGFVSLQQAATQYDPLKRPVTTRVQAGGVTYAASQATYDPSGRVMCTAQRMNPAVFSALPISACTAGTTGGFGPDRIAQTTYDLAGRPITMTTALGRPEAITESVTYTANGQPQSLTDGEGNVSVMVHDPQDRLSRLRYPNATGGGTSTTDYEEYGYDAASNVVTIRNRAGETITTTYDALNRPTLVDAPVGTDDVIYVYDNLGRLKQATNATGAVVFTYDALGRVVREDTPLTGTLPLPGLGSQYDAAGRRTRLTWPGGSYYATYDYDLYGNVTRIRDSVSVAGGKGVDATYTYDHLGRRTGIVRSGAGSTTYGYDAVSRLTSLSQNPTGTAQDVTWAYTHNSAGQIVGRTVSNSSYVYAPVTGSTTYVNNDLNQVTTAGGTAIAYDARQNITTGLGTTYGYDAVSQLTTAGTATMAYDPLGRLYRSVGTADSRFLYDGAQAVAEYDASGNLIRRHVPGTSLDETVATYEGAGPPSSQFLLADERGSVVAVTDYLGTVGTINRYDEYGVPASGNAGRFQYTGQMWLPDASVYHYRARAYAPQIGRFLQTDPIGYAAGANLYVYVGADPINFSDPWGLDPIVIDGTSFEVCIVEVTGPQGTVNDTSGIPVEVCYVRRTSVSRGLPGGGGNGLIGYGGGGRRSIYESFPGARYGHGRASDDPTAAAYAIARNRALSDNAWMGAAALGAPASIMLIEAGAIGGAAWAGRLASKLCNCFVEGTPVHTRDGVKSIEDIAVGDLVLARDEVTGETAYKPVTALIAGTERQIWAVTVEIVAVDGTARRETIGTTDEHPWRLVGGQWRETAELAPGDELVNTIQVRATVVSVTQTHHIESTFNFEVEGFHTYFVGNAGLLVHNLCKPLYGPIANFRRSLASSGQTPRWMNQWLRQGRSPPGHEIDHLVARSAGGTNSPANLRLRTTADHRNRHLFYHPWR